jgi:hypothetical protein
LKLLCDNLHFKQVKTAVEKNSANPQQIKNNDSIDLITEGKHLENKQKFQNFQKMGRNAAHFRIKNARQQLYSTLNNFQSA